MHSFFFIGWATVLCVILFVPAGQFFFSSCIARLSSVGVRVLILMGISIFPT